MSATTEAARLLAGTAGYRSAAASASWSPSMRRSPSSASSCRSSRGVYGELTATSQEVLDAIRAEVTRLEFEAGLSSSSEGGCDPRGERTGTTIEGRGVSDDAVLNGSRLPTDVAFPPLIVGGSPAGGPSIPHDLTPAAMLGGGPETEETPSPAAPSGAAPGASLCGGCDSKGTDVRQKPDGSLVCSRCKRVVVSSDQAAGVG